MLKLISQKLRLHGAAACIPRSPVLQTGLRRFISNLGVHLFLSSDTLSDGPSFLH